VQLHGRTRPSAEGRLCALVRTARAGPEISCTLLGRTHALVGFRFMGTSPGEGLVLQGVGRMVYSPREEQILFLAGQHEVPDPGGEAVFCAALT
jgi:hypothetical protein